jgi:hypothetical protein
LALWLLLLISLGIADIRAADICMGTTTPVKLKASVTELTICIAAESDCAYLGQKLPAACCSAVPA